MDPGFGMRGLGLGFKNQSRFKGRTGMCSPWLCSVSSAAPAEHPQSSAALGFVWLRIPGAAPAAGGGRRELGDGWAGGKKKTKHLQALSVQLSDLGKIPGEALKLFRAPSH